MQVDDCLINFVVIIRTNSADTTLTIDAKLDTIRHYDLIGSVNIIKTANSSYHEFGIGAFVQVASGRVVADNNGIINTVILTEKGEDATLPAVIEIKGNGQIINKYAITNAVASSNNAEENSVQLILRTNDTEEGKGNVLLTSEQEELTGDSLSNIIAAKIATSKNKAIGFVNDEFADAPDWAYYAQVDENNVVYYSKTALPVALIDTIGRIVLLQDGENEFLFLNQCQFTLDLYGHYLDLTSSDDGLGGVAFDVTITDTKGSGSLKAKAFEPFYFATFRIKGGKFILTDALFGGYSGNLYVSGGIFNRDPSGYLESGYTAVQDGDVWTVIKA